MTKQTQGKIYCFMQIEMKRELKLLIQAVAVKDKVSMQKVALRAIESYVKFRLTEYS